MPDFEAIHTLGKSIGFSHVVPLDPSTIELKEDVRQMCTSCHRYGKRWSCPPGCGSLEDCRSRLANYTKGVLVQTVGELEDELDGEGMMETEATHREHFQEMFAALRQTHHGVLALGAGCCNRCTSCTYPDAPCRFPEECTASMEAYGMLILDVCRKNNLLYYYGKNTIAYTGCFLFP